MKEAHHLEILTEAVAAQHLRLTKFLYWTLLAQPLSRPNMLGSRFAAWTIGASQLKHGDLQKMEDCAVHITICVSRLKMVSLVCVKVCVAIIY